MQDAVEAAVEQAVEDGLITEEEAEAILNPPDHQQGGELKELLDSIVDHDQILADALGITVEELELAREEGIKLDELIDELGLDQETVRQDVQDATEAAIEQAVEDGLITEEEAEALLNPPARPGHGDQPPGGRPGGDNSSESSK